MNRFGASIRSMNYKTGEQYNIIRVEPVSRDDSLPLNQVYLYRALQQPGQNGTERLESAKCEEFWLHQRTRK